MALRRACPRGTAKQHKHARTHISTKTTQNTNANRNLRRYSIPLPLSQSTNPPSGVCAGKNSVKQHLLSKHDFIELKLTTQHTPEVEISDTTPHVYPTKEFPSISSLLDFALKNWQSNFVTSSIYDEATVDQLSQRPFFILIYIDAPITLRWERFRDCCHRASRPAPTLEEFVLKNDERLYSPMTGIAGLESRAGIKLLNATSSVERLYAVLDGVDLLDQRRLRPTWDQYFMKLAGLAARRSNCMRRQVGCVIVREKRVISTGYNGTPRNVRNCNEGGCERCNSGGGGGAALSTCLCIHAEENALLEAGRERIGGGAVLYCNTCPCLTCTIKIVQAGITEVVYSQSYYMDADAARIFKEAKVQLRQFLPPAEGLVKLLDVDD
ncbi:deoxycytidylate deaminase [Piedraia hortae CBS 480.64]|uniref:Deoxycytidylate deaminase n=1 Tax=Piedraia hortae CBS 480.64 TaxID=1314780 RepID=A0A6A7C8J9_9PEZI|nr:deoxycytidylate deaminase [Piedraia hortae CBS 480.64]